MERITDRAKFDESLALLTTNINQVWSLATSMAVSAVEHYVHKDWDSSWAEDLLNLFLDPAKGDSNLAQCLEKMLYACTNLKIRQDETDLTKKATLKSKGNMPEGWVDILATVEKEGIKRYMRKAKTARAAKSWNNDGQKQPRQAQSTAADVTTLSTTPLGTSLAEAVKSADGMTDEQKAVAQKLADNFKAQMEALAKGETLPTTEGMPSAPASFPTFDDDIQSELAGILSIVDEMAHIDPSIHNRKDLSSKDALLSMLRAFKSDAQNSLDAFKRAAEAAAKAAQAHANAA